MVGWRRLSLFVAVLMTALARPGVTVAQDEVVIPPVADTVGVVSYPNTTAGEFTPARGFDIIKTKWGSLNISMYGLFRYLNQLPDSQLFRDHLGRIRSVKPRNDLNWHRTMVWLTGFFFDPKFRYNITLWSLPTTQQTLLFGNLQYLFSREFRIGVGIAPNLTARSLQGSWPFWAGSDRAMAEEFFRGGFSSGLWVTGEPVSRFYYTLSVNTNISQLGVTAQNDTRNYMVSGSVAWLPTTGEFGPRGGFGDLEYHRKAATRFGLSGGHSREARYSNDSVPPNATQIKLSDGINPFDFGALAEGVLVRKLTYNEIAADAGIKYRGYSFQFEYYWRWLSDFLATGQLPDSVIFDQGFMAQAMYMVVPHKVGVYISSGFIYDDFHREPWELGGGVSWWPSGTRSWRNNLHIMYVDRSPASSTFGYYIAGQTGPIISIGVDILL